MATMGKYEADCVVTDPPYNVAIVGATKDHLTIENDDMDESAFKDFLTKALENMADHLKEGGAFYIWHASMKTPVFFASAQDAGLTIRQVLQWVKSIFVLGRQDYQWRHEPCLYGWKDGAPHYFIADRTRTTVAESTLDIEGMSERQAKDTLKKMLAEYPSDVIHEDKPARSADHPTMKPVALMARQVFNSTHAGDIVLDPFGGSGSTLAACEQIGRRCAIMELDPVYCDVIIKRWENLTGRTAERVAP
jgi:site-specific DNA-methyltransferase (adenine-specific)